MSKRHKKHKNKQQPIKWICVRCKEFNMCKYKDNVGYLCGKCEK